MSELEPHAFNQLDRCRDLSNPRSLRWAGLPGGGLGFGHQPIAADEREPRGLDRLASVAEVFTFPTYLVEAYERISQHLATYDRSGDPRQLLRALNVACEQ